MCDSKQAFPPEFCCTRSEGKSERRQQNIHNTCHLSLAICHRFTASTSPRCQLNHFPPNRYRSIEDRILALLSHRHLNNSFAVISHPLNLNPSIHSSMDEQHNTQNDGGIQDLVNKLDMCIANFDGKRQVFENAIGEKIQALPIAVCSHPLTPNPSIHSSMDGQDNTQNDGGIQDLVNKLDMCIANFDGKRQVFENAIGEKIQALEKDRGEARELRLSLHQESGDTRNKKIDDVNQWLNQKALISGAPDHFDFSVLIVDDDLAARDSIRRALMSFGAKKQLIIDVQEAKNGREAVYLHLAGASFDIILMDSHMPIMTGREAIKKLRQMGVKSQIIGVSYQFEQPAFRGSSINKWIRKAIEFWKGRCYLLLSQQTESF
ncbi:hypothetical protein OIU76_017402 [Salix suchowensis]|nr:hypothetical protein OIU76_017402 [Salix suchowensis]